MMGKKSTSIKETLSKVSTFGASVAEYVVFEGVGKTIKNFATGAATGAKQGYQHFTTDKNVNTAIMDVFEKVKKLAQNYNSQQDTKLQQNDYYQSLTFPEKFTHHINMVNSAISHSQKTQDQDKKNEAIVSQLEKIVKDQIKDYSTLTLDSQYDQFLTNKQYTEKPPTEKMVDLNNISQSMFNQMDNIRLKQPEFLKIEKEKDNLYNGTLSQLALIADISKDNSYQNATYESKINSIQKTLANKQTALEQTQQIITKHLVQLNSQENIIKMTKEELENNTLSDLSKQTGIKLPTVLNQTNQQKIDLIRESLITQQEELQNNVQTRAKGTDTILTYTDAEYNQLNKIVDNIKLLKPAENIIKMNKEELENKTLSDLSQQTGVELPTKLTQTNQEKINFIRTSLIKQQEELTQQSQTIVSDLKQLNKAKQTLRKINNREIELLKSKTTAPKQNIATRTLKTAAGLIAGATIGALKGSGSAIKTGGKAMLNASSGIRNTYEMNRNNIPKSTKQNQR